MKSFVLISGASGGLGKAFAVECASRGYNLLLTDLSLDALETLAGGLRKTYPVEVRCLPCDLSDAAARGDFFAALSHQPLRFWALINVAGVDFEGLFCQQSTQHIRTILRLNIEGTLELTHALIGLRDPFQTLRIINVASLAAFYPMPLKATYAASKRFLLDFSLALREELAGLGASVTVLCPAGMPTTPECIAAIDAQGWMGQVTSTDTGAVAAGTLDAALRGRAVYIPGMLNRLLQGVGGLVPPAWIAGLVARRWKAAHRKRFGQLQPAA